jgi:hypothetical protein
LVAKIIVVHTFALLRLETASKPFWSLVIAWSFIAAFWTFDILISLILFLTKDEFYLPTPVSIPSHPWLTSHSVHLVLVLGECGPLPWLQAGGILFMALDCHSGWVFVLPTVFLDTGAHHPKCRGCTGSTLHDFVSAMTLACTLNA